MILHGNALTELQNLPDKSVHCCVTSPPYFRQRYYGTEFIWDNPYLPCQEHEWAEGYSKTDAGGKSSAAPSERAGKSRLNGHENKKVKHYTCRKCQAWKGELGWEPTPEMYIAHLFEIFSEVHRVLRDDGLLFVNITDTYKRKVRYCIPERFVLAMSDSGTFQNWLPVQDIIWYKRNPMIESVKNRCTKAHEYVYIFSKKRNYFFDNEAIKEDIVEYERQRRLREKKQGLKSTYKLKQDGNTGLNDLSKTSSSRSAEARQNLAATGKRNRRSVWEINNRPEGTDVDHYATYSPELPMICIQAGTSEHGCCPKCNAPYRRIVRPSANYQQVLGKGYHDHNADHAEGMQQVKRNRKETGYSNAQNKMRDAGMLSAEYETIGWRPTCNCESDESTYDAFFSGMAGLTPATVLDPFAGSGTTGIQASKLGRNYIMIEAKQESVNLIGRQMRKKLGLFNPVI